MDIPYLKPLIPIPIYIEENGLVGKLDFRHNLENNHLVVFFKFTQKDHKPSPVKINVEVLGTRYVHELWVVDVCNNEARTPMICPPYRIYDGISICSVEPIVRMKGASENE